MKALISQRDSLVAGNTARVLVNYNLWLLPVCFELLVPRGQQARKEIIKLAAAFDLDNAEHRGMD